MKKALAGAVVLIALLIAAPFVNGLMMEKILRSQVDKANELYESQPYSPNFEITRYARGFGTSEIEFKITFSQWPDVNKVQTIIISEKAKHGILGATSTASLTQNSWYNDFINESLEGVDPLTITSQFNMFSGLSTTLTLAPFEFDADEDHFVVSPATLDIKTDRSGKHLLANGSFDGFSIADVLDLKGCSVTSDIDVYSTMIMDGDSSISVDQISVYAGDQNAIIDVSTLKMTSTTDYNEESQRLSTTATYSVDKIVTDDEEINNVNVSVGINQLDSESLQNLYDSYISMVSDLMANISASQNDPEQIEEIMQQQLPMIGLGLLPQVEKLLTKDLQIEITDLHVGLSEGDVDGGLAIALKKDMTLADFATIAQQPQTLVDVFSFASNLSLPEGLIPDQQSLLVPLFEGMQTGVFEQQGGKLVHQAEIKDDQLLLNGQELVL
ncbi:DUF945 family protein [Desulfuromonas acetoxidans]|uniref:DUF945 family protein n=1 Tax=Desulfuromonas acetoxidans TaxID=891 RepID=UPI00292DC203|nr:DUF945 family protein [Desulfuromonas acetoxidans]